MPIQDTISLRAQDLLHRVRRAVAGSQSTIDPPFGDSPNLPDIYYVDSGTGSDSNDGRDPGYPKATIDSAIGSCTASQGDVILVQPGHSETVESGIALDVIGVSVIGVGNGTLRPQLTLAEDDADCISITAANCLVENIYFNEAAGGDISGEQAGSDINIAAAYATVRRCWFDAGTVDQEQITITADGDYAVVEDNEFHVTAQGPDAGIEIEGTVTGITIRRNKFNGGSVSIAWDLGAINSSVAFTLAEISDNRINFCAASTGGIQLTGAATGQLANNILTNGTLDQMLDPGSMHCVNNFQQDAIDESGGLYPDVNPDASVGGGAHGTINATTTDSIHGKLGEDTNFGDRSIWDILEGDGFVAAPTAALPAINVNIHDELAWIANAVRPGTGAALGTNESLADVLYGAGGIVGAFPAAAAPTGTGVSLAQGIRYTSENVRTITGAFIPDLGIHIEKTVDCSATADIFTITGLVLVKLMYGEVESGFDGNIANMSFRIKTSNETLCAATAVGNDTIQTLYLISGDPTDTMNAGGTPKAHVGSVTDGVHPMILGGTGGTETIEMLLSAADTTTASFAVHIYYIPLEASAAIAAA